MPNIPAKLFDYRVLTLEAEVQTDLAGIFINIVSGFGLVHPYAGLTADPAGNLYGGHLNGRILRLRTGLAS